MTLNLYDNFTALSGLFPGRADVIKVMNFNQTYLKIMEDAMDNEIIKTPPTGKYTGVITDIQFLKKHRGTVIVTIAVYIRNKVEYYRKSYRNIFENGRSAF